MPVTGQLQHNSWGRRVCPGNVGRTDQSPGSPKSTAPVVLRGLFRAVWLGLGFPSCGGGAGRHAEAAGELVEWWEDLWQRGMTSRVVLVAVPSGWGRTTVLNRLAEAVGADDAPVTLIARINGRELPDEAGSQAAVLRDCLAEAGTRHPGPSYWGWTGSAASPRWASA